MHVEIGGGGSRLLAAELCVSARCLLDPTPFSCFPLTSHPMCRRVTSHTDRALHRFVFGSVDSQNFWKLSAASKPLLEVTTATLFTLNRARRLWCSDFLQECLTRNVFEPWIGHRLPYLRSSTSAGNARNDYRLFPTLCPLSMLSHLWSPLYKICSWGKVAGGVKLTTHLNLASKSRMMKLYLREVGVSVPKYTASHPRRWLGI
jgi:hypothetical protein